VLGIEIGNQRMFRPELIATDGRSNPDYLQLNLQSITPIYNHPARASIRQNDRPV
jgi:hypothetical protein